MSGRTSRSRGRSARQSSARESIETAPKPTTKDLLIATSEQLFGRSGIDGVSLREIGAAAGQTNSNVVQYHFSSKRGLIRAIMNDRLRRLEVVRRERLEALAGARGARQPREALRLLWGPLMSVQGAEGDHTFCRFLLQYLLQPQGPEHPSRDVAAYNRSRRTPPELSVLGISRRLLRGHCKVLPASIFNARLTALSMMFLSAVVEHDNARLLAPRVTNHPFDLEPILDMAIAALAAPVTKRRR